jgi:hypothetical protein
MTLRLLILAAAACGPPAQPPLRATTPTTASRASHVDAAIDPVAEQTARDRETCVRACELMRTCVPADDDDCETHPHELCGVEPATCFDGCEHYNPEHARCILDHPGCEEQASCGVAWPFDGEHWSKDELGWGRIPPR